MSSAAYQSLEMLRCTPRAVSRRVLPAEEALRSIYFAYSSSDPAVGAYVLCLADDRRIRGVSSLKIDLSRPVSGSGEPLIREPGLEVIQGWGDNPSEGTEGCTVTFSVAVIKAAKSSAATEPWIGSRTLPEREERSHLRAQQFGLAGFYEPGSYNWNDRAYEARQAIKQLAEDPPSGVQDQRTVDSTTCVDAALKSFCSEKLAELEALRAGWDCQSAPPIDRLVLDAARRFIDSLPAQVASRPMVVPLSSGGVQFEWHHGPRVLELEFESPKTVHYLKWDPERGIEEEDEVPVSDGDKLVSLIRWFMKGTSDG